VPLTAFRPPGRWTSRSPDRFARWPNWSLKSSNRPWPSIAAGFGCNSNAGQRPAGAAQGARLGEVAPGCWRRPWCCPSSLTLVSLVVARLELKLPAPGAEAGIALALSRSDGQTMAGQARVGVRLIRGQAGVPALIEHGVEREGAAGKIAGLDDGRGRAPGSAEVAGAALAGYGSAGAGES